MPTATDRITKTPGVCGGEACIRGTRIAVWGLVEWRQLGKSDDWLLGSFPGITRNDLAAVWEYAASHPEEIAKAIQANLEA